MFRAHLYERLRRVTHHHGERAWSKRSNFTTILPIAAFGTMVVAVSDASSRDQDEERDDSTSSNRIPSILQSVAQISGQMQIMNTSTTTTTTTSCDAASLWSRLTRTKTAEKIKHLADKRKLNTAYDVNWDIPLGEGGFGAVYGAVDKKTKEKVALKKISKAFTNDDGFQREMEAFLQIRTNGGHPNICGLHDYFDEGGDYYLSLDMILGGEMFDHLINSGPYSEADAARLVQEVARALDFLHGIGIVHGDLKPENLMLSTSNTSDAVVKVIDFGTAQVLDENGKPTVALSGGRTEAYCPPEIIKQDRITRVDPSMDMWAVGVILYIMLVGAHPFDLYGDGADEDIAFRVVSGDPVPLEDCEFASHLSEASADLIRKLLAYRTEDRLTARELLQHPWVQGITASHDKIEESNKKLKKFRKIKTKLELKVFEDMFKFSEDTSSDATSTMSLIERSFRGLDTDQKGFVTAKDMGSDDTTETGEDGEDESLSLSAFSTLLSDSMKNEYYCKGDIIYKEGDKGHDMLFINSGVIEVTNKAGFRTTLKQGDFVGEGSLISDKPRSGTVKCVTPVHAIKITKEYFDKYLSTSDSGISLKMLERSNDRENSRIIFSAFSELLSENMKNEHFDEGSVVYREGDRGDDVFFINSGMVEVSNKDGFRTTLKQGDFVGEGAVLSNNPRSGTVVCLTPVDGMKITKDYFDKYLASSDSNLSLKIKEKNRERALSRNNMVLRQHSIIDSATRREFSGGELLYKEGDGKKSLYIVEEGIVELVVGGHAVLNLKPGDVFGEHSIVFSRPRNAGARCVTGKCKVIEIEGKDVERMFAQSPSLKDSVKEGCLRREFQKAVVFKTKKAFPKNHIALKAAFKTVTSTDEITLPMMGDILRNTNPEINEADVKSIFNSIDINARGSIDFQTFKVVFGF